MKFRDIVRPRSILVAILIGKPSASSSRHPRPLSSPGTRPDASPPTSPSCRSCCAERTIAGRPLTVVNQRWLPTAAQGGNDAGREPHPASFLFFRPPFSRYFEDEPGVDGRPHRMYPILTALPALHRADLPDDRCHVRAKERRSRPIRWRSTECLPILLSS